VKVFDGGEIRSELDSSSRRARFEALFVDESRALLGYALRRVEFAEDAADIVAETFLVAWRRIDEVPRGREARLWLYGVARRVCANHTRSVVRRHRLADRLRDELLTAIKPDRWAADDAVVLVREAMQVLDDTDRELLKLNYWEGLSPMELAEVLAIPAGTVRSRLYRARQRMRIELENLGWRRERLAAVGHVTGDGRVPVGRKEEL
jgi:RNA polymerase sigma-70 factor (ECF subfamily)